MKTLIPILVLVFAVNVSFSQCDKNLVLNFNEIIENRNGAGTPMKAEGTISFSKEKILIRASVNGGEKFIESIIQSVSECKWDSFPGTGRTAYKVFSGKGTNGPKDEATLNLEGVKGKLKVIFRPPGTELQFSITDYKIVD